MSLVWLASLSDKKRKRKKKSHNGLDQDLRCRQRPGKGWTLFSVHPDFSRECWLSSRWLRIKRNDFRATDIFLYSYCLDYNIHLNQQTTVAGSVRCVSSGNDGHFAVDCWASFFPPRNCRAFPDGTVADDWLVALILT